MMKYLNESSFITGLVRFGLNKHRLPISRGPLKLVIIFCDVFEKTFFDNFEILISSLTT